VVSVGAVKRGVRRKTGVPSCPSVLEPADGACSDDEGRQRSVMCKVKAAPADEARVVRHLRRREAPALEVQHRGFRGRCESKAVIECALDRSIEAGPCE